MRIRVATLNTWGLPEPFSSNLAGRMRAIGRRLAELDLDVIAFQEIWTDDARKRLIGAGRQAGLAHSFHQPDSRSGGLLVLTRLPIRAARFDAYALRGDPGRPDHPDYYGQKGFITLELASAAGPISLVDTHLHARYRSDVPHAYLGQRVGQIVELALATRELPHPVIAVGDLNFGDHEPEHAILTGLAGLRDLAAELGKRLPTVQQANPYRGSSSHDRRVDYVLARDGGNNAVIPLWSRLVFDERFELDGRPASCSDHAGVLVEVELVRGAARPIPPVSPQAISLASQILREGRRETKRRRRGDRAWAGTGLAAAATLATLGTRERHISRRRLLRSAFQAGALLSLTPGVGLSIVSEWLTPPELRAFDQLAARLARAAGALEV
jgi:endonuclease/exonuclease/phosphatase family metal-dependent hydrolase